MRDHADFCMMYILFYHGDKLEVLADLVVIYELKLRISRYKPF